MLRGTSPQERTRTNYLLRTIPTRQKSKKCKKWKTISFIVFLQTDGCKTSVLSILRCKNLIKIWLFLVFWSKRSTFDGEPAARMQKTQKSEKNITFSVKNCKIGVLLMVNLERECFFGPGNSGSQVFWIFRFCGMWRRFSVICLWSGSIFCYFPSFSSEVSLCT